VHAFSALADLGAKSRKALCTLNAFGKSRSDRTFFGAVKPPIMHVGLRSS